DSKRSNTEKQAQAFCTNALQVRKRAEAPPPALPPSRGACITEEIRDSKTAWLFRPEARL
ncbi:hypothetical protein HispidOSU_031053, partial [Sigmodon hispidus]